MARAPFTTVYCIEWIDKTKLRAILGGFLSCCKKDS
jgi:hypothetical protein